MGSKAFCDLLFPYQQKVIGAFGPDLCRFEGSFPVNKKCISFGAEPREHYHPENACIQPEATPCPLKRCFSRFATMPG